MNEGPFVGQFGILVTCGLLYYNIKGEYSSRHSQPASQHPEAFVRPSGNDQIIFNLTFKGHATVCSNIIISNLSWSNRVYYTQRALDFGQYTRARVISKLRVVDGATYYEAMKCQSSTWYTPTLNRRVLNQIIVEID